MMYRGLHPGTEQERELVEAPARLRRWGVLDCVPLLQSPCVKWIMAMQAAA